MSVIYDALKKVEKSDNINSTKNKANKPKLHLLLIYALIVCLGIFIANIFWGLLTKRLQSAVDNSAENLPKITQKTPERTPKIENLPVSINNTKGERKTTDNLILEGVFFSEGKGYALINNQIVKEGDLISGAKVKGIALDGVYLEFTDSTVKLSLHNK